MSELSAATQKGIKLLRRLYDAKRPVLRDLSAAETLIDLDEGELRLDRRVGGYCLTAPDGLALDYTYAGRTVEMHVSAPSYEDVRFSWDFTDPLLLKGNLQIGRCIERFEGPNDLFVIELAHAMERLDAQGPRSQAFKDFSYYFRLNRHLRADVIRRIAAVLPSSYFEGINDLAFHGSAPIGCSSACWVCALATTTGPTPDDVIWCGLCLICVAGGGA